MGTGNCYEKPRRNCDDLPFAGITLFRFNGFYLSFLQHPEDGAKLRRFFKMNNCNFILRVSFYDKINLQMKKIALFACLFMAITLQAQNKMGVIYDENVQVRKLPNFTSIRVSNAIELFISQSNKTEVAVSATSDEYRNRIITEVVGGTLIIRMADNYSKWWKWGNEDYRIKAYVSVNELYALTGSGATNIKIVNGLSAEKLKINLSGASDMRGDIKAGTLLTDLSGASSFKGIVKANAFSVKGSGACNFDVSGGGDDLIVDVSGATSVKMYDYLVKGASVDATGASSVKLNVSDILKVRTTGASSIDYKGAASIKEMQSSGASSVKHRN